MTILEVHLSTIEVVFSSDEYEITIFSSIASSRVIQKQVDKSLDELDGVYTVIVTGSDQTLKLKRG